MVGKLSISKETDKFNPYSENHYDSGWVKRRLLFNVTSGDNRHMLNVDDGCWEDGHGDVFTFSKATVDESGEKKKGELLKIPFKERLTSPKIAEVAGFKLEKAAERLHEGKNLTDEELKEIGLENESDVTEALEKSNKKRHEFIAKWDFAEFIKKVIDSEKYKDSLFFISGNGEYSYNAEKETMYDSLVPTRIYLAADDAEESATATVTMLFGENAIDDMSLEEKGKYYVSGYMMEYESSMKKTIPIPVVVTIPNVSDDATEKEKKKLEAIKKKFYVDGEEFKEYGIVVNMLNGAQKVEITEDMLTEEQKDDLDCGLITMDDIRAELGRSVYGDAVKEWQFVKPAKGFTSGSKETAYTSEDMIIKIETEEVEDLFQDEDDDL